VKLGRFVLKHRKHHIKISKNSSILTIELFFLYTYLKTKYICIKKYRMAFDTNLVFTQNNIIQLNPNNFNGLIGSNKTTVNTKTVGGQIDAYTRSTVVQDAIDIKSTYLTIRMQKK
jgi:hypothetical protein